MLKEKNMNHLLMKVNLKFNVFSQAQRLILITKKNVFIAIAFIFAFVIIPNDNVLLAQNTPTEKQVAELFKNPKKIMWYKHYKGRVDDINDVGLIIAYDGKHCKGFITYLRSRERFKLEGSLKDGQLKLRETDAEESVTGHFEGKISQDFLKINAHWFNREKTKAGVLELTYSEKEIVFPSHCGDNKWIRTYTGLVMGNPFEFIIQRNNFYDLQGVAFAKKKNISYTLKGAMTSKSKFKLVLIDDLNKKIAAIEGEFNFPKKKITGYYIKGDGEKARISFNTIQVLMVGCIEYQDYMTTYDVIYPKSTIQNFNHYIDTIVGNWKKSCMVHVNNLKKENPFPGPDDRAIANASGWYHLDFLSHSLASGFFTFNKSWEEHYTDLSFTFDLTTGQKINLEDIFKKNIDYHHILREKALQKIQFKKIFGNANFRKWIIEEDFKHFTIRPNGIRYSTNFHPIYGRQSVTILFEDIEEYLHPNSPILYLYNPEAVKKKNKKKIQR